MKWKIYQWKGGISSELSTKMFKAWANILIYLRGKHQTDVVLKSTSKENVPSPGEKLQLNQICFFFFLNWEKKNRKSYKHTSTQKNWQEKTQNSKLKKSGSNLIFYTLKKFLKQIIVIKDKCSQNSLLFESME